MSDKKNKRKIDWIAVIFSFIIFAIFLTIWNVGFIPAMVIWFAVYFFFNWLAKGSTNKEKIIGFSSVIALLIFIIFLFNF
ncbi:MAG TPA: hypothetical protein PKU93_00545 [Candidatus Pacearchaeota archaeon]|nr:hypothetical protein [Candidatus Pacearchaeota archaeon]